MNFLQTHRLIDLHVLRSCNQAAWHGPMDPVAVNPGSTNPSLAEQNGAPERDFTCFTCYSLMVPHQMKILPSKKVPTKYLGECYMGYMWNILGYLPKRAPAKKRGEDSSGPSRGIVCITATFLGIVPLLGWSFLVYEGPAMPVLLPGQGVNHQGWAMLAKW